MVKINLSDYSIVIINSSGGKDSLCALFEIARLAKKQGYSKDNIVVSHQDLGRMEWNGVKELACNQAELFGFRFIYSKRRDKNGNEETLLDYVERRKKWPSRSQRYCTSDFKRGPGARIVTSETKDLGKCKVLYVFGFRAEESPARKKKEVFSYNQKLSTNSRQVYEYLPIHDWNLKKVWRVIRFFKLPYHWAYDQGMPRLSCVFCIFSPFDALVLAGIHNPQLLDEYIKVEDKIGHTFRDGFSLHSIKEAIDSGYKPKLISDWTM